MQLDSTLEAMRAALAGHRPRESRWSLEGRTSAGVAVPLHDGGAGAEVLMIKRTDTMRHHAREVAFPGGRADPEDRDLLETALRETHEELALAREDLEVLGALSPVPTATSHYLLHPFLVVVAPHAQADPHPGEVEAVIRMPVADFFAGRVSYRAVHFGDWDSPIFDFEVGSMYGASAHVLEELLSIYAEVTGWPMPRPVLTDRIPWQ
ncbi:MAG TPA: CoA pyrophosphatase [Candidatus Dormibacteraeota bacterium]